MQLMIRLDIKNCREAAKISALSSGKIDKYEYLTGEEILPSNQRQKTEQAKFPYSHSGKAFEKQKQLSNGKWNGMEKQWETLIKKELIKLN